MTELLQDVTRCLLSAGGAADSEGDGLYLLYVNPEHSSLSCKHWNDSSFDDQELVATAVRDNSTASYLVTSPNDKLIIYISSSNIISGVRYDDDEEEWAEDDSIAGAHQVVHPKGKLTAALDGNRNHCTFFQDASNRLVYLNNKWSPTVLPAQPIEGSALATSIVDGKVHVFYISAKDNCMHHVAQQGGSWHDSVVSGYVFEKITRRFIVTSKSGKFESYVLTEGNKLMEIDAQGKGTLLGDVDSTGKFIPKSTEECGKKRVIGKPYF